MGPAFAHHEVLKEHIENSNTQFIIKEGVNSLIEELSHYSLAVTGGGITPFEAAASGLPSIVIANETFEIPNALKLASIGCSIYAGYHADIEKTIFSNFYQKHSIEEMSSKGLQGVSLEGVNRVSDALCDFV